MELPQSCPRPSRFGIILIVIPLSDLPRWLWWVICLWEGHRLYGLCWWCCWCPMNVWLYWCHHGRWEGCAMLWCRHHSGLLQGVLLWWVLSRGRSRGRAESRLRVHIVSRRTVECHRCRLHVVCNTGLGEGGLRRHGNVTPSRVSCSPWYRGVPCSYSRLGSRSHVLLDALVTLKDEEQMKM